MANREYKLDPAHSWTFPGLAWNCALKILEAKLELITDPETFLFFENAIRGGISTICHQYAKANNKYLPNYDPDLQSEFLIYLDANNLYGYALSQPLPVGKFLFSRRPRKFRRRHRGLRRGQRVRIGGGPGISRPPSRQTQQLHFGRRTRDRDDGHV